MIMRATLYYLNGVDLEFLHFLPGDLHTTDPPIGEHSDATVLLA